MCRRILGSGDICNACALTAPFDPAIQRCTICYEELSLDAQAICAACKLYPPLFRQIRFLWDYDGNIKDAIRSFKYAGKRSVERSLLAAVRQALPRLFPNPDWDIVIPVPSRAASFAQRGFNQCVTIARACAAHGVGSELDLESLRICRAHKPQAQVRHSARRSNVLRSFAVHGSQLSGRKVLLVDDVLTTGATATSCLYSLKKAGASVVDLMTLARAQKHSI